MGGVSLGRAHAGATSSATDRVRRSVLLGTRSEGCGRDTGVSSAVPRQRSQPAALRAGFRSSISPVTLAGESEQLVTFRQQRAGAQRLGEQLGLTFR